jgi:hypothetical protein
MTWSNYTKALLDAATVCDESAKRWRASGLEERAVAAEELAACFRRRAGCAPAKPSSVEPPRCTCGEPKCAGVMDGAYHQCGGPTEACGIPGCPECRAPVPTSTVRR